MVGGQVPDTASLYLFFPLDDIERDLGTLRNVLAGRGAWPSWSCPPWSAPWPPGACSRPLRRARRAVHRLEVGLLETRLPVAGSDEFADLAESFNRMAEALERTVADLRALEASQRRFVADVSHELRTPLTALTTAADVLEAHQDGLDDTGRRAARLLVVESRRLAGLVEDLMEISRLDAGVAAMAWERRRRGRPGAGRPGQPGLVGTGCETRPGAGRGHRRRPPPPRRHRRQPGRQRLRARAAAGAGDASTGRRRRRPPEVADGGPGIAPEHLASVFERFYKADPSRPRSAGSGLGLAIARENARLHGGDVTVANRPGAGAVFTVVLPRTRPPSAPPPRLLPTCYLPATRR